MSTVNELEERVERIQAELDEAEAKLAGWERKQEAALSEFEAVLDEGDETPHEESSVLSECRFAVTHFKARVASKKQALKHAREALAQARYSEGVVEVRRIRQEAADGIARVENELIETIHALYGQGWDAQRQANGEIERFNVRIAYAIGAPAEAKVSRMSGMAPDVWAEALIQDALRRGDMEAR